MRAYIEERVVMKKMVGRHIVTNALGKASCILLSAALLFAFTPISRADQPNTLESLRSCYSANNEVISTDLQQQTDDALAQYSQTIETLFASLNQKGDLAAFTAVSDEKKRFENDKSVPAIEPNIYVADAVALYNKQMSAANAASSRRRITLLKKYIVDLNNLTKDLLAKNDLEAAKEAGKARYSAQCMLVSLSGTKPPGEQKPLIATGIDRRNTSLPPASIQHPVVTPRSVDEDTDGRGTNTLTQTSLSTISPLHALSNKAFDKALKKGHGKWSFDNNQISSQGWSFCYPGMLIFGNDTATGSIQATLINSGYEDRGCQGLVMCVSKATGAAGDVELAGDKDDRYHKTLSYFVRCSNGKIELFDSVPYYMSPFYSKTPIASSSVKIRDDSTFTLRLAVEKGDKITVWVDERKVLVYTAKSKLSGKYALLGAKGKYVFQDVKYDAITSSAVKTTSRSF